MNLNEQINLLERFSEYTNECRVACDRSWHYTYINEPAEKLLGIDRSTILGCVMWDIFPDLKDTCFYKESMRAMEERVIVRYEEYLPSIRKWLRVQAFPDDVTGGLLIIFRDSTDKPHRKSKPILESELLGIIHFTMDGQVTDANDKFLSIIGYTRQDLQDGRINWLEITPTELRERDNLALRELLETGKHEAFEKAYIRKDSSRVPILIGGALYPGSLYEGVSFILDLTDIKRSEQQLERLLADQQRLLAQTEAVLKASNDGIEIYNASGELLSINPSALHMYGFTESADLSADISKRTQLFEAFDSEHRRLDIDDWPLMKAIHFETFTGVEALLLRKDNGASFWGSYSGATVLDAHGNPSFSVLTIQDITERKQSEVAQKRFVREMLFSLTEGRLHLCYSDEDFPKSLAMAVQPVSLDDTSLSAFRKHVQAVAVQCGFSEERIYDLITGVSEASMNAVRHAQDGIGTIYTDETGGVIQISITDKGGGIASDQIHLALERGWTTGGFGHGFWYILKTLDRIYLLTGPTGTKIVLEMDRTINKPFWIT